ncbi:methylated-DNA--[protein]-cysteine S-methyltransferase [Candidatus Saccharibacteria bacterium]|jgi:O-6-methylguanine DNA methyltransferase|nr:methylated-DNA--[protein]-cysteine S-methyltransferase [Candidatus Saccharibacteria bacterium]
MDLSFTTGWPAEWSNQIDEYLRGGRKKFDIKIEPEGTEFQKAVWREMAKIPYGQTRTYAQIAEAIGNPKAARAVGTACGKNQYVIILPCHRVVATNGLGGFALGLEMKKRLLELEQKYK